MNLRVTTLFFGLLLTMLWLFGLMVAHKKAAGDLSFVMPTLQGKDSDFAFEKVNVKRKIENESIEADFVFEADKRWYHHEGQQKVRVLGVRIDNIIRQIKAAKFEEHADVQAEPAKYGLKTPPTTVTIHGKYKGDDRTWTLHVGNESAGNFYVQSSDRDNRVFAVAKRTVEPIFNWKNPTYLRDKRLFDYVDLSVSSVLVRKAGKELELKKGEGNRWTFVKPANMGIAGFGPQDADRDEKKKDPHKKDPFVPTDTLNSVQGLLTKIKEIHVDDDEHFVPLGKPASDYGLKKGEEHMRVAVHSVTDDKDKKAFDEILLIGNSIKVDKETYYYARLDGDDGVMKIHERLLDPVVSALNDPGKIRSLDVAHFDKERVDVVVLKIKEGKKEFSFFKLEETDKLNIVSRKLPQSWHMIESKDKIEGKDKKRASHPMVEALIMQALGKRAIVDYPKGTDDELKKKEAEWGLADPTAVVAIYENGIAPPKKDEKKDEKKKDEKKADSKDEKTEEPLPMLKEKHTAEVTLAIGNVEKEDVHIRRTLKDGTVTYFTMKKEFPEKILPKEGVAIAYLDTALPELKLADVTALTLRRVNDKSTEILKLQRRHHEGKPLWYVVDEKGENARLAASSRVEAVLDTMISRLAVKKWVKPIGENDDLQKLDLKPTIVANITIKKDIAEEYAAKDKDGKAAKARPGLGVVAVAAAAFHSPLVVASYAAGAREVDPAEPVTIALGKDTDDEKDKPGTFAIHSGKPKLLFLTQSGMVKAILNEDLRDRTEVLYTQNALEALYRGTAAVSPHSLLMLASPYFSGTVHEFDYKKVVSANMTVRTQELRSFSFARKELPKEKTPVVPMPKDDKKKEAAKDDKKPAGKEEVKKEEAKKEEVKKDEDKEYSARYTWEDKSGLKEFTIDPEKLVQVLKDTAKLRADRFVSFKHVKKGEFKPGGDFKLEPDKATVILELVMDDKSTVTLIVGTSYLGYGHFATSDAWPGTVFFVSPVFVDPILRGPSSFSKERIGID